MLNPPANPKQANEVYLDCNSTTYPTAAVARAMYECLLSEYANPASQHADGRRARKRLEAAKDVIAQSLGLRLHHPADRLILTSGGTESNNLALRGLCGKAPGRVLISAIEHPSILVTSEQLSHLGFDVCRLPVDGEGRVIPDVVRRLINNETRLVSVMLANHETGVIQPLAEVSAICREAGVPLHTDATQVIGKMPIDFQALQVDAMTFTAHKFHGPRGIGGLVLRQALQLVPLMLGGTQQWGSRPGTESVMLAVGLEAALREWQRDTGRAERMRELRDRFESRLLAELPHLHINGAGADRLPHTSNLAFLGWDRQALFLALDRAGIACSTGSACSSGSSEPSPVLTAMNCPEAVISSSLRFSLGAATTRGLIDLASDRIIGVVRCAGLG